MENFDRTYLSQFSRDQFGLSIVQDGVPVDPDGNVVTANLVRESDSVTVAALPVTRLDTGLYEAEVSPAASEQTGLFHIAWLYEINGSPEPYRVYLEIGQANPDYDGLDPEYRQVVEDVWLRFADLYDSPDGSPHFTVYFQSKFSRGRVASIMRTGLRRINGIAGANYTLSGNQKIPLGKYGSLLEQVTVVEVIKHIMRSYVEQPQVQGVNVANLDRRDYLQRWQTILQQEEGALEEMLDSLKIDRMGLVGSIGILVGGGAFGRGHSNASLPPSVAARGHFVSRYH